MDAGAVDKLLDILAQDLGDDEVDAAVVHTLTNMAKMSEKAAEQLANSGGPARVVEALRKGYRNAQLSKDAIYALGIMSEIDPAIMDYIRGEEIVYLFIKIFT